MQRKWIVGEGGTPYHQDCGMGTRSRTDNGFYTKQLDPTTTRLEEALGETNSSSSSGFKGKLSMSLLKLSQESSCETTYSRVELRRKRAEFRRDGFETQTLVEN